MKCYRARLKVCRVDQAGIDEETEAPEENNSELYRCENKYCKDFPTSFKYLSHKVRHDG